MKEGIKEDSIGLKMEERIAVMHERGKEGRRPTFPSSGEECE